MVCGVSVEEEVYKIFNVTTEWSQKTSYHCDPASDGTWFYYLDTSDECIGEVQRLVLFEAQKDNKKPSAKGEHTSENRTIQKKADIEKNLQIVRNTTYPAAFYISV